MPKYTEEPAGLAFINNLNMATFGPLTSQGLWVLGSSAFTVLACYLMVQHDYYAEVGAVVEGTHMRQMVMVSLETTRQLGKSLADALLLAWTGKTVVGAADSHLKRTTSEAYVPVVEAKARGKAAGAAAGLALAEAAKEIQAKREEAVAEARARNAAGPTAEQPIIPEADLVEAEAKP